MSQDTDLAAAREALKLGLLSDEQLAEALALRRAKGGSTAFAEFLGHWGFLDPGGVRRLVDATGDVRSTAENPAGSGPVQEEPGIADAPTLDMPPPARRPHGAPDADSRTGTMAAALEEAGLLSALGPFEIARELGRGGMGKVYLARDTRLDRTVALKVMRSDLAAEPAMKQRFLREARTAAGLDHPNVVKVYETGESPAADGPSRPWIAMEYVEGTDLAHLLHPERGHDPDSGGPESGHVPTLRTVLEYLRQTAEALAHAHRRGLVHRDVKPSNVLVTRGPGDTIPNSNDEFGIVSPGQAHRLRPGPRHPERGCDKAHQDRRGHGYAPLHEP